MYGEATVGEFHECYYFSNYIPLTSAQLGISLSCHRLNDHKYYITQLLQFTWLALF